MKPKTRFVRVDGIKTGYQVFGDGPVDLLYVHGVVSHIDLMWGDPAYARFMNRLGSFARVITFDRRGVGVSERLTRPPTLDERVTEMIEVLDAARSDRAIALGFSDGGMGTALLAATHPERVTGLILCCTAAKSLPDDDQPGFIRPEYVPRMAELLQNWGQGHNYELFSPTLVGGQIHRQLTGVFERAAATREMMLAIYQSLMMSDITAVLPSITVPTTVIQRTDDFVPFESGRFLAENIPGARLVAIEGTDHVPFAGNANSFVLAIEKSVAEATGAPARDGRAFQTIQFADVRDEDAAATTVRRHGGRVLEAEDGELLAIFDTPAPALKAGADIARGDPSCRVGIHSTKCLVEGNKVVGVGVHLAARLRAEADPGQVLISDQTKSLVPSGFEYRFLGSRNLKGISATVPVFAVGSAHAEAAVVEHRLRWSDRVAVAMAKMAPAQTRLLQRVTNPSYARAFQG
jgi:pimeloyl-ACP methyl ester carboxylesterase